MLQTIEANWVAFALALVIGLLVAWWLFGRASTPARRSHAPDVLDEGAAPARRNQALIDAPPAAQIVPPPLSAAMGGVGEAVAIGAQDVIEAATLPEAAPVQPAAPSSSPASDPSPVLPDESPTEPEPAPQLPEAVPGQTPSVEPAPSQPAPPQPVPAQPGPAAAGDDLSRIKGLGPKLQSLLPTLGITSYAQIAALDDAALDALDGQLGAFAGRPRRDSWVAQARLLAAGDLAGFESQFGKA